MGTVDYFVVSMYSGGQSMYMWEEDLLLQLGTDDPNTYTGGSYYSYTINPSTYFDPASVMVVFWYYTGGSWQWNAAIDDVEVILEDGHWETPMIWTEIYSDWFCVDVIDVCDELEICFKNWVAPFGDNCDYVDYRVCAWTALCDPMDDNPTNDLLCEMVSVWTGHDVGVEFLTPVEKEIPWYAHEFIGDIDFDFDPATPGTMNTIAANTNSCYAGTWAKDAWYQYNYDTGDIYTVDTTTGAQTPVVTTTASLFNGIAFDGKMVRMFKYCIIYN
jgi:hypothetical protein